MRVRCGSTAPSARDQPEGADPTHLLEPAIFYESKGELTIVPERGPQEPDPGLVRIALRQASTSQGHPAGPPPDQDDRPENVVDPGRL